MQTRTPHRELVIDAGHTGLPEVAHGGYVAGALAAGIDSAGAQVTLRRPVPTGRPLRVDETAGDGVELRDGETLLATATPAEVAMEVPAAVTLAQARAAEHRFPGFEQHILPDCVGCGPNRGPGEGLRIFPGPVQGRRLVAAPWVPSVDGTDAAERVPDEVVWAAFDCPQLWALIVHVPSTTPDRVVTAALATRLHATVRAGAPHVVMAWPIGREGRTWVAGAALFGPDGELCAVGRQDAAITSWGLPLGRAHWPANDVTTTRGADRDRI